MRFSFSSHPFWFLLGATSLALGIASACLFSKAFHLIPLNVTISREQALKKAYEITQ